MNSNNPDVQLIFAEALRLSVPAERAAYLDQACAGNPALRREVESLLAAHAQAGDFLSQTRPIPARDFLIEPAGAMIGRYRLLEKIGEGGFGVVYMAEQVDPVQRKVALKIVKPGMDSRQVITRFEAERQALALMDHPNIAKVLDGGATETGRPYFVMELVRGMPITDYCDQKKLPTAERLRLFMKVCHAVQHAHQKGIIHRDLKPSNVLVALHDGEPVPKVIDFGVAKALGQKLTAKTVFTGFSQMLGTPAYMSPEQAELSGLDVDTRSDIYSLGVLLYELLTGVTPFDKETLAQAALDEVRRLIRETEPPRPSTRLQTLGERLAEVAMRRQTEPATLSRMVRGDLDWIVMKALEKDRTRRYETANELALDLTRHLQREPVSAAAPAWTYRASKFVRRHQSALAVAAALLLLMAAGTTVSVIEAVRAKRAEREQSQSRKAAEAARREEGVQRARAAASADESLDRLILLNSGNGARLLEQGDYSAALPWLAEALRLDTGRQHDLTHRLRLGALLRQLPRPIGMWFHQGQVRNVAFSPDGQWALTCGDTRVCVWSVETTTARIPPIVHSNQVSWACFGRAGTMGLSTAGELWIWNPRTGVVSHRLHPGAFYGTFSDDGRLVASVGADRTARVWSLENGQEVVPPISHSNVLQRCVFSPDSRLLATCTRGSSGQVWDLVEKKKLYEFRVGHSLRRAAFSPDGTILAAGDWANAVYLWNARTGERISRPLPHGLLVEDLTFSGDGQRLASCSLDGTVRLWEPGSGALVDVLAHPGFPMSAQFSEDDTLLLTRTFEGRLHLWEVARGKPAIAPVRHSGWVCCAALHPGGRLALAGCSDGTVRLWDLRPEGALFWPWPGESRRIVGASQTGRFVVTQDPSGVVSVWDAETWHVQGKPLPVQGEIRSAFLDRDASRLLLVQGIPSSQQVRWALYDPSTGERISESRSEDEPGAGRITRIAASPDSRKIALARGADTDLLETASGKLIGEPMTHATPVSVLEFSTDSTQLAINCAGILHVIDTADGQAVFRLTNNMATSSAAFSPDGAFIASAGSDVSYNPGEARVWEAAHHKEVRRFRSTDGVHMVAFSSDSRWLATAGENGTARVWDFRTGQPVTPALPHPDPVFYVAFSPDDRLLATLAGEGEIYVWDVATGEIVAPGLGKEKGASEVRFVGGSRYLLTNAREGWRFWRLAPADGSVEDLANLACLFAGHRLDRTGALEPLPADVQRGLYEELRGRRPEFFTSPEVASKAQDLPEALPKSFPAPRSWLRQVTSPRPPGASRQLIDLTFFYNGSLLKGWDAPSEAGTAAEKNLGELPSGLQRFAGVPFDVRGVIQLSGLSLNENRRASYPTTVKGIPVDQKCRHLHFLHGTSWSAPVGQTVGHYIIHYSDKSSEDIPLVYGQNVADWWYVPEKDAPAVSGVVAWTGNNDGARAQGKALRLYKLTWANPRPDSVIAAIDLVSENSNSSPFLIAVTAEP